MSMTHITHEAKIYIGNRLGGYGDLVYSQGTLEGAIGDFQKTSIPNWPVRVTPTTFISGRYREMGWEISLSHYPPLPADTEGLDRFTLALASHLQMTFKQRRVTVVLPTLTHTLEDTSIEARV